MNNVAVIIPCYNVEGYIFECLDSVKKQGDIVSEIYCVDNNSTDDTLTVINTWISINPDVSIKVLKEFAKGACAARNKPLNLITSDWIQFLDADDLLLEGKISQQINKSDNSDIIYDSCIKRLVTGEDINITPQDNILIGLMKGDLGNTCANLWDTKAIKRVGGWNEEITSSQEYDLMMRMYKEGASFQKLNTFKTVIRQREVGQISQGNPERRWENYTNIRVDFFNSTIANSNDRFIINESMQLLFRAIQLLFYSNSALAIKLHNEHLSTLNFKPKTSTLKSQLYLIVYLILGFRVAENIRTITIRKRI